jgi:hypothetical protein
LKQPDEQGVPIGNLINVRYANRAAIIFLFQ